VNIKSMTNQIWTPMLFRATNFFLIFALCAHFLYAQNPAGCDDLTGIGLECDSTTSLLKVNIQGNGLEFNNGVLSVAGTNDFSLISSEKGSLIGGNGLLWNGVQLDIEAGSLAGTGINWNTSSWAFDGPTAVNPVMWNSTTGIFDLDYALIGPFVKVDNSAVEFNAPVVSATELGIGSSTVPAGDMLAVKGNIIANGITVDALADGWPDYVFGDDYELISLVEVEEYLERDKHLPGIDGADELRIRGLDLAEMNALLLKKIEELTLYIIEREKTIESTEHTINFLQEQEGLFTQYLNKEAKNHHK